MLDRICILLLDPLTGLCDAPFLTRLPSPSPSPHRLTLDLDLDLDLILDP